MKALEDCVRSLEQDGLVWGASKLVPIGYGTYGFRSLILMLLTKPFRYPQTPGPIIPSFSHLS